MSEESLAKKYKGIKEARIREAKNHEHPWQKPKNFIENEYSRSKSVAEKRGLTEILLYTAETEIPNTVKIGWTYDTNIREKDGRYQHTVSNSVVIAKGPVEKILLVEKEVKEKFFNESYYALYKSTEIFPIDLKDEIINFINSKI